MSPEQAQSFADIDGRTDLFSVGAILFEMLAGKPPHLAPTYEAVLIAICTHDAADVRTLAPEVTAPVAALVARALQRERDQRFQSAREFLTAISQLDAAHALDGVTTAAATNANSTAIPERKRYRTWVAGIVATLAGFALTAYFVAHNSDPSRLINREASPEATRPPSPTPAVESAAIAPAVLPVSSAASVAPQTSVRVPSTSIVRRPAAPKPSARAASGLQLSTKEP
jgi:serine/threonine protein kinase